MIAIPAVDLRGGDCVQLVGGDPSQERVAADPRQERRHEIRRDVVTVEDEDIDVGAVPSQQCHIDNHSDQQQRHHAVVSPTAEQPVHG